MVHLICLHNENYETSIELGSTYATIDPLKNDPHGYHRLIDESGEDYLYPADWFVPVVVES
jgi:hypothetical protein